MALGIPASVSPVGVNTRIVDNGINGYYSHTSDEWERAILSLYESQELLSAMSNRTQQKIIQEYSVSSNSANFLSLFS